MPIVNPSKIQGRAQFIENAEIPSYDFSVKLKDRDEDYSIMISKKGGQVVESSLDREVNEEKISRLDEAVYFAD